MLGDRYLETSNLGIFSHLVPLKSDIFIVFSSSQLQLQKNSDDNSKTQGAKKIKVSHQRVPRVRPSTSKYKSDPKEQQITNEAVSKRNSCAGLRVAKVKDKDLIT